MNECEIYIPLHYNDGRPIEKLKFVELQESLVARFGGLTIFPEAVKGFWRMGTVTYQDDVMIHRVVVPSDPETFAFLTDLKHRLKVELQQHEILIIVRDVNML